MAEKLKVKFLTVIWGASYVEEFARVSLPSYLAPGNIPLMARETDLEVLIMTSRDGLWKFDEEPTFRKLRALCPVRYIYIDDLITTGIYGVTLTLAYARGVRDSGDDQTNTTFVFMNSDFVLANGSLATLMHRLKEGHRCVMAPSLRACSETTLPVLQTAIDSLTGALTMAPRQLVKLAFANLHPTVIAKTVTQNFITCMTHNQIYWQVDKNTMLAHYYLVFMLAIRPEVPMEAINSYCDYGFVPELVPSGRFTLLKDSDEFFMLELQSEAQENFMLRCGSARLNQIADHLSQWTTREHRRFAEQDVIFHASDLPAELVKARDEAAEFMAQVRRKLKEPKNHADHVYWTLGVQAWAARKYGRTKSPDLPPELASSPSPQQPRLRNNFIAMLGKIYRLKGIEPDVALWSYLWLDFRLILQWASQIKARVPQRNLLICDTINPLASALSSRIQSDIETDQSALANAGDPETAIETLPFAEFAHKHRPQVGSIVFYDNILILAYRANVRRTRGKVDKALKRLKPNGTLSVYIRHADGERDSNNFSWELAQYVNDILASDWIGYRITARFAGGRMKRLLRQAEAYLLRLINPTSVGSAVLMILPVILWPIVAALTALNNLRLMNRSALCPDYCSSALVSISRLPTTREDAASKVPTAENFSDPLGCEHTRQSSAAE